MSLFGGFRKKVKKYEIWDMQHHIVPEFYVEELKRRGIKKVQGVSFPSWTVKKSLSLMKGWNISRAFLSVSTPGVHFGNDKEAREFSRKCNDYILKCIDEHPGKFGGFASVPLPDVQGAIEELKYTLDKKGMDGLFLMSNVHGRYLGDKEYRPFFEELNKREAVVFIHPHTHPEQEGQELLNPLYWWYIDTTKTLLSIIRSGYHRDFPNIKYIVAHGGGTLPLIYPKLIEELKKENPGIEEELEKWKGQLYLDTAKAVTDEVFSSILSFTDLNHIVFASDYVWADKGKMPYWTGEINKKGFGEEILRKIYCENSKELFNSSHPGSKPIIKDSGDVPVTPEHLHAVPECVVRELEKFKGEVDTENLVVWDREEDESRLMDNGSLSRIAIDIPDIWKLEKGEINRVFRLYNRNLSEFTARNPEKYKGFGAINIDDVRVAIEEINYCIETLKLDGLCIYVDLADSATEQTLHPLITKKIAQAKVPVMVHPKDSRGIPIENPNYLDAEYFMAKVFYSNEIEVLKDTDFILTHTCGILGAYSDFIGALYYLQFRKRKWVALFFDYLITKKPKGDMYIKKTIMD
jgi:predicted TIM-barrel fold metal-dependent hydrolase